MKGVAVLAVAGVALLVAGCTPTGVYEMPNLAPDASATVTGSRYKIDDPTVPDTRIYAIKVDGLFTYKSNQWNDKTIIAPGKHLLEIGVSQKSMLDEAWGFGAFTLTFEAGKTYYLRAEPITHTVHRCAVTQTWVEADNVPVSAKVPVMLGAYNGMELPLAGGGSVNIPSTNTCPSN